MYTNAKKRIGYTTLTLTVLGGALLALGGCSTGYTSPFMRPSPAGQALKPDAGTASVVFVRPSGYAEAYGATIFDGEGKFLGQIPASSHFAVNVPAGKRQTFWIWAENVDGLQADLAPGKSYYIEVAPTMGWASPRMHLYALKPNSKNWDKHEDWVRSTQELISDTEKGSNYYRTTRWEDVQKKIKTVEKDLAKYQGEDLAKRTLEAADGV